MDRMAKWTESVAESNDGIWKEIQIPDAKGMDGGFSKEVDRFLFVTTARIGYGEWDEIHRAVARHPLFRFNFWLKMQSPMQLKQRVDTILRSCGGIKRAASKRTAADLDSNQSNQSSKSREQSLVRGMEKVEIVGNGGSINEEPPSKKQKV